MNHSADEIAIVVVEGGEIVVFAALGLVLTAIVLGSACNTLRTLPRGFIRWSAAGFAVLGFEMPFLWLVGVEPDVSLGEFAGAVVLGVIGFVLATCCTLALMGLGGLLAGLAGKADGAEKAHNRRPSGRFAISGRELAWALGDLLVNLCGALR